MSLLGLNLWKHRRLGKKCFAIAIYAFLFLLTCTKGWTQATPEEKMLLEKVRSGQIPLTDELIEKQRNAHPELRNYSNQEIREKLQKGNDPNVQSADAATNTENKKESRDLLRKSRNQAGIV